MLGWINNCIEKLVIQNYGLDSWHRIKKEAGCAAKDFGFFKLETYPDRSTYDLVGAATTVLGLTEEEVWYAFGVFFAQYIRREGYETLLCCQGSTLKDWMTNINAIHHHIQTTFPKMMMPQFWCEDLDDEDDSLVLHYHSGRGSFLAPVAVGLITEVADYQFDIQINMKKFRTQGVDGAKYTSWKVSTKDPQDHWKLREKVGGRDGIANAPTSFKCPFTGLTCPTDIPGTIKLGAIDEEEEEKKEVGAYASSESVGAENESVSVLPSVTGPSVWLNRSGITLDAEEDLDGDDEGLQEASPGGHSSETVTSIGFSGTIVKQLFPYNIILDANFTIVQVGKKLPGILGCREDNLVGFHVAEQFMITKPIDVRWNWKWLRFLEEQSFDVTPLGYDSTTGTNDALRFKTTVAHISDSPPLTMLIMNPDANNLKELQEMNLTLSDLSVHGAYRDAIFLREHLSTQMKNSLQLEKSAFESRNATATDDGNTEVAVHHGRVHLERTLDYSEELGSESKIDRTLDESKEEYDVHLLSMSNGNFSEITHDMTLASNIKRMTSRK